MTLTNPPTINRALLHAQLVYESDPDHPVFVAPARRNRDNSLETYSNSITFRVMGVRP